MQTSYNILRSAHADRPTHTQSSRLGRLRCALRRIMAVVLLMLGLGSTTMAADYVLAYVNGNTTYYLARNGTTGVQRVTTFDPTTCIWSCSSNTAGTTAGTLNNSNTYGYLFQTVNGTRYFLGAPDADFALATSVVDNYYRWRTNDTYVYNRYNGTYSYYINLANGVARNTTANTTSNARPYSVTSSNVLDINTNPTINGNNLLTTTGNHNYTATGANFRIGYKNYYFNNTDHYVDANGNTITPANATLGTTVWNLTSNDYATVNSSGTVIISTLPESDITLTLTATIPVSGGVPAAPSGTTLTASKEITIQGTKPSAPIITVNGSSVTLSTEAVGTTSIRYTTNGTTPTATTGTVYNGAIDLSSSATSPVTIKAVTVRNGNVSDVSEESVTLTLPAPTISVNGDAGTATISATAGATIYYTTDGSTPTTSSSQYSGSLSSLAAMTTINAIAVKDGWNNSPVASELVTIPSGVSGGTVTLFDYEDHTWTYYSGVDASVDNGNYNASYRGKLYSPDPRNVKITYKANGGAVSINESETEFVYYKTIEKVDNAYKYTVISNPFSKRPNGQGFGGWRIKEGAQYINGYNDEAILPLDAELTLTGLDANYTPNCTSAEIELEATWVTARVTYLATVNNNNNNYTFNTANGSVTTTYENNFLVINRNYSGTLTVSQPVTILMVEPNGSTDYRNTYTFTGNITPNNNGVTKIEFTKWNSTNTVNANFKNLWIGRGMTTTSQCATLITGLNTTNSTAGTKFSIKVESGKYDYFDFYKGHSTYTGGTANTTATISGTAANAVITIGNDYDRAKGSVNNQNLEFKYGPMLGYQCTFNSRNNRDNEHTLDLTIKSGRIGYTFFMEDTNTANYLQGGAGYCMYLSSAGSQTNVGRRNVLIEGGDICTIGSGIDSYNNAPSNNDNPSNTTNYNRLAFNVRIKGGIIHGNVYGGAAKSPSGGNRVMIMTGGQVKGWFAAGCNGTDSDGGQNYGTSWVYIGGNAKVDSEGSTKVLGYANGGNVYAAGAGRQGAATCGEMTFGSNLVIADNSYIERGIYGGGNYGYAKASTYIYITGGTNEGKDGTVNNVTTKGGVYGGANQQDGPDINMYMTGGVMKGGVYGGCNTQGTISNNVTMNIHGGQVGTSTANANIHGGGYGSATRVSGNVDLTLGASGQTTPSVTVYGDVYGGSALGYVNGTSANTNYHTYVTLNKGTINGSLYGGGLGDNSTAANVYAPVVVTVNGGSVAGAVFGCNNIYGSPQRAVDVVINATDQTEINNGVKKYALQGVYGGGNLAHYDYDNANYPTVTINGCGSSIKDVYGGGNAAAVPSTHVTINGGDIDRVFGGGNGESGTPAHIGYKNKTENSTSSAYSANGNVTLDINGGTINQIFGGSNAHGTIKGAIAMDITKSGSCEMHIGEVYGGGNEAAGNAGSITIGCTGGEGEGIGDLYGGANKADVNNSIALSITGGSIQRVFGGNNTSGAISGTIQVSVNWNTTDPCGYNYLGSVFGAGNLAQYTGSPVVNILNGTVTENVYGGGKGDPTDHSKGQVTGNPVVTIGDASRLNNDNVQAVVGGDVYGGGDAGNVVGTPQVNIINKCNTSIANVYGGGNAADVNGTDVNIDGGIITGMVFGGGHGDKNANPQTEANVNGNVAVDITGGSINKVFGGSNSKGAISGSVTINIEKDDNSCEMHITEVYGGGNEAEGNAGEISIGCTGDFENNNEGIGTVYGGANQANVGNSINLTITGGHIDNVYGGNNQSGSISGTVTVNVDWSDALTCGKYLGNVFGGGNLAALAGAATVNIKKGTVSQNVYGGGNQAGVGSATINMTGGSILQGLYGGCNTSGTVGGAISVSLTGGQIGTSSSRADVFGGGLGSATATSGNIGVTLNGTTVYGDLYGGSALGSVNAADANPANTTTLTISTNTLHGTIYGGGKGDDNTKAESKGNVIINYNTANTNLTGLYGGANINGDVAGDIQVNVKASVGAQGSNIDIYGGGLGAKTTTGGNVTVTIDQTSNPTIYGDIYGGSAFGKVGAADKLTKVDFQKGTLHGKIYGGGKGQEAAANQTAYQAVVNGDIQVNVADGTISDGIYGGCNANGNVVGDITVNLSGSTIGTSGGTSDIVFGGGYGSATTTDGNITLNISGATVHGNAYGGSALGNVNNATDDETNVNLTGGIINGSVYGGGLGNATTAALVKGSVTVTLDGSKVTGNIFGCNNVNGTPLGHVKVWVKQTKDSQKDSNTPRDSRTTYDVSAVYGGGDKADYIPTSGNEYAEVVIDGCGETSIGYVYGGGNAAAVPATEVTINGTYIIDHVFGGGNGAGEHNPGAHVGYYKDNNDNIVSYGTGTAVTKLYGGKIHYVFGGSNTLGNIRGGATVSMPGTNSCTLDVKEIYGAGKVADMSGSVNLIVGCVTGIDAVYGGAMNADIEGGVTLIITSGTFRQVFGGNNVAGTIQGPIKVYIEETACDPINISELYLGGNQAPYSVYGYKEVTVNETTTVLEPRTSMSDETAIGSATAYSASQLYADPELHVISCTSIGRVFGGGLGTTAIMYGNPTVNINMIPGDHATSTNALGVIGGSYSFTENNVTETRAGGIYGGGSAADVIGNTTVNIGTATSVTLKTKKDNQGDIIENPNPDNVQGAHIAGNVYGGGLAASVDGDTKVNIGTVTYSTTGYEGVNITGSIFGGGEGQTTLVTGDVEVKIGESAAGNATITGDIYGGSALGNVNAYLDTNNNNAITYSTGKTTSVTLNKGTVNGSIYGGGLGQLNGYNEATSDIISNVYGPVTVTVNSGKATNVFGCNNLNGSPKSTVEVLIEGSDASVVNNNTTTYAIGAVYGGGNMAHYDPTTVSAGYPSVTVNGCSTSIEDVYGGGNAAAVPETNVTINGGDIKRVFAGGNGVSGTPANVGYKNKTEDLTGLTDAQLQEITYGAGTALATINGGTIVQVFGGSNAHGLLREGSKVDIEKNGSCEMHITDVFGGGNEAAGAAGEINIKCTGGETEGINNVYGGANKADVSSDITLNITGGRINNVFGGNNERGNVTGKITVNIEVDGSCNNNQINNVYGGGNLASYTPTTAGAYPEVNIKNGTISGNVFGGGLGATAKVYSNPVVTIGDVSEGHSSYVATVTGNVYGGGSAAMVGDDVAATASINNTTVLIQKSNTSVGKVFGGGAQAGVTGTTTVTIADGSVSSGVYGGCDESGTVSGDIAVYVNGGTVGTDATHTANVHGGGLGNSTATGADVTVIIGNSTTTPTVWGDVYGGSGYGNVNAANSDDLTKVWLKKGTINGNVYGGGLGQKAAGNDPAYAALVNGAVEVVVDGGTVTGSVFGCNNANGAPQSTVTVDINATDPVSGEGYALSKVFGGGNEADYNGIPQVTIHGCDNTIEYVYGGGNLATVKGTVVTVYGGRIGNVFGGGYGASVTSDGTDVNIYGGTIGYVFGGNNQSGTVTGQISVDVDKQTETGHSPCEMHIGEVYGGGNLAASQAGTVTIGCTGTATEGIQYVYGGAKDAQVTGDINLTITGGRITEAVFGGNNVGHTVEGDITVNIEWDGSCDQNYVKDVFGGGNMAPYYNAGSYPAVNIKNGIVSGSVYGGGKGADAVVTANPVVTIGDITEGHESYVATVSGNVFGGGDAAAVDDNELLSYTSTNNTTVLIQKSNTSVAGKVFGGGNEAGVKGNAQVTLASGSVAGGVYGGCNTTGTIGGTTQVNVTGGTVGANAANAHANVHGGGYGQGTAVSGNVTVNIGTVDASTGATIYGDIYGGSAMGTVNTAYNATTHTTYETTTVNLYSGTIDGNVYGGGLGTENIAAYVYGNAEVYQYGAILISRTETDPGNASLQIPVSGMIFGCNNVNGTPKGHVKVVVLETTGTGSQSRSNSNKNSTDETDHVYDMLAVFGGGNRAAYEPDSNTESTEVIINGCNVVSIHSVYGGGNAASTPATKVEVIGTYEIEYVFGGGNGAGSTNPGANVGYKAYPDNVSGANQISDRAEYAYGTGKASTNIYGGRIHKVFGGSNTKGNVRQASVAMLDEVSDCEMILDGFYGGGKSAYMEGKGDIHLGCVSGLTEIYGGAERADVGSDVVLTLTSGHYDKVYGGNNLSGNIHGSITINIEQTGCKPITIGELFGGGNNAAYSVYGYDSNGTIIPGGTQIYNDPVINIRSCQSIDAIYGGGEGENATLYGNPHINVNIVKGWIDGRDDSNNTPADINVDGVIGTIYGGGKKADVNGDTYIFIADQSTVEMQSLKDLKAKINSATSSSTTEHIEMQVTGSGDNEAITYTISGNASPTLTKTIKQTVNGATINGNVYGGGREADITGSSHIKIGPKQDDEEQQSGTNPAPIRSEQPQQPAIQQPVQNSATESQQSRTVNPVRL